MNVDEFIEMIEQQAGDRNPIVDEMKYYNENPEQLVDGSMVPNFENLNENRQRDSEIYHFYLGTIYGVGLANKHDIGDL